MVNSQGTYLAYRNWVEESDVEITTSATVVGDRLVTNLANSQSDDVWRVTVSGVSTSFSATFDFGVLRSIDILTCQFARGIYPGVDDDNPTFASTDTIRWRLYDLSDVLVYDSTASASGVAPGYMLAYHRTPSAQSAAKLVVDWNATSRASAGFVDVGSVGAWTAYDPNIGFAYPANFGWQPNNEVQRTSAGRIYTSRYEPYRRWTLLFDTLSNNESMSFDEMVRWAGGARQCFVRRGDLPAGKNAMLCLLTNVKDTESVTPEVREASATFEEFI